MQLPTNGVMKADLVGFMEKFNMNVTDNVLITFSAFVTEVHGEAHKSGRWPV